MLALALPTVGSSCADQTCRVSEDCPVGQVCGRGRICAPRQCGFIVDGSIGDSCQPGYRCIEGVCQIRSADYLDASGAPEGGPAPAQDSGAPQPTPDVGGVVDTGPPAAADTGGVAPNDGG